MIFSDFGRLLKGKNEFSQKIENGIYTPLVVGRSYSCPSIVSGVSLYNKTESLTTCSMDEDVLAVS